MADSQNYFLKSSIKVYQSSSSFNLDCKLLIISQYKKYKNMGNTLGCYKDCCVPEQGRLEDSYKDVGFSTYLAAFNT